MGLRSFCLCALLLPVALYGQSGSTQFDDLAVRLHSADRDSMVHVDSTQFRGLVEHLCSKLKDTPLEAWSDTDHINLMRSLNTIMFEQRLGERYHGDAYQRLEDLSWSTDYRKWASANLGGWVPNRGMGFYFIKLDMELEGTPTLHGRFNVH